MYNRATESPMVTDPPTDRAPIIVSPNNASMDAENSNSGSSSKSSSSSKDVLCKAERSVIVRAGSSSNSSCASDSQGNVNKQVSEKCSLEIT